MQSVLSPIVGRLSDVVDRKWLASIPPLIAFAGAVISAKATSMSMLIGGGILIGVTLSTISIVQAIPSEVLPLKYRALANGFAFIAGALGGLYVITVRVGGMWLIQGTESVVSVPGPSRMSQVRAGGISSGFKQLSISQRFSALFSSTIPHAGRIMANYR